MAIKVCGCTVIDDSRCLNNIQDACITGTLTATNIVGDGSQLTGVGGGGPSAQPLYMELNSASSAVSKGEPVSFAETCCSCAGYNTVTALNGDPTVTSDSSLATNPIQYCSCSFDAFEQDSCVAVMKGYSCYQCCCCFRHLDSGTGKPGFGGYQNTIRITQDKYVQVEIGGGIGYCCKECFFTGQGDCNMWTCQCLVARAGVPSAGNWQIPCYEITEFKVDPVAENVCINKTAHLTASANLSCPDQQCYDYTAVNLCCAIMGYPMGATHKIYWTSYACCCDQCCGGSKQGRIINGSEQLQIEDFDFAINASFRCCCCSTCEYQWSSNLCRAVSPFLIGPAANFTMNLPSCTGNKFYALTPVTAGRAACSQCNGQQWWDNSVHTPMSNGLMSFCLCSNGTEMDAATLCMQYDLNNNWRYGYVSRNKRFMFGEQSRVNAVACGVWCHCNRGCGFIYVNEINDSFVPNPQCGCIASTNRLMEFGTAQEAGVLTCTEQEWRFWPTSETCDGWVIATQPIDVLCYACWCQCNKRIDRKGSYLKMFAIKPIATGCACVTNVVCLCHTYATDGGICWGCYNDELCCCTTSLFKGLDYLACDETTGTPGAFLVFDHDDRLHSSLFNRCFYRSDVDQIFKGFSKPQKAEFRRDTCNGAPLDYASCGALPATNLTQAYDIGSNQIKLCFNNYWIVPKDQSGFYPNTSRASITTNYTCGDFGGCIYGTTAMGGLANVTLSIDNATDCLTISSCTGFTSFCTTTYNRLDCNFFGGMCAVNRESPLTGSGLCKCGFQEVNTMRAYAPFGNGNALRFTDNDVRNFENNFCCTFPATFGGWCGINNCFGEFCGCGTTCTLSAGFYADRPMIEGYSNLIDPLAFTWVTKPFIDQGRFTENYVYHAIPDSPSSYMPVFPGQCSNLSCYWTFTAFDAYTPSESFCANKNRPSSETVFPQYRCNSGSCVCIQLGTMARFPFKIGCTFCVGVSKYHSCVGGGVVCGIPSVALTGTPICQKHTFESGSKIFAGSPESHNYYSSTSADYRYVFVSSPCQNNKNKFVGWATEDTQPGCKVPIMTLDRGYLPIDANTQGWCDLDLSSLNQANLCSNAFNVSGCLNTCVTNLYYDTYAGNCCLSCSPFKTCISCTFNSLSCPIVCFVVDADCCCCAYVTTKKTRGI